MPADGVPCEASLLLVDESTVTGESVPADKTVPDSEVVLAPEFIAADPDDLADARRAVDRLAATGHRVPAVAARKLATPPDDEEHAEHDMALRCAASQARVDRRLRTRAAG